MTQRMVAGLMFATFLGMAQQTPQKQFKNRQEFDLYTSARNEQDPAKKLAALDEWKGKFPETDLREDRNLFYLSAYLGLETIGAKADASPAVAGAAEKAAHTVIDNLDTIFAESIKPSNVKEEDWAAVRKQAMLQSHGTLGAIAMLRKDYATVEAEMHIVLGIEPKDANAAVTLSRAIIAGGKQDRYPEAIYQVARAVSEVPDADKQTYEARLRAMYEGYHGDAKGLDEVKEAASKSALPPPGFKIESVTEISQAQIAAEEKFNAEHPEIVLWRRLRDQLTADGAEAYFEMELKNVALPTLKGKVLGQTSPKELTVLMDYVSTAKPPALADATIKLDGPWTGKIEPGTVISFTNAVAESFSKDPYNVTMRVDRKSVEVLDQQR